MRLLTNLTTLFGNMSITEVTRFRYENWTRSGPIVSRLPEDEIEVLEDRALATIADPAPLVCGVCDWNLDHRHCYCRHVSRNSAYCDDSSPLGICWPKSIYCWSIRIPTRQRACLDRLLFVWFVQRVDGSVLLAPSFGQARAQRRRGGPSGFSA